MEANSANKFFDALAAGRPVAINYGGWHRDLLARSGAGIALAAATRAAARSSWPRSSPTPPPSRGPVPRRARLAATRFDRDALAAEFASVLERVAQNARG